MLTCRFTVLTAALLVAIAALAGAPRKEEAAVGAGAETASHQEVEPLAVPFKHLTTLCLHVDGRLLAGDAGSEEIKVIGADGAQTATMKPGLAPEAIDVAADGTLYCGGRGKLAKLDKTGKVLATAPVPATADAPVSETSRRRARMGGVEVRLRVSGIAVTDTDVFVAFGSGWSLVSSSKLFRFDRELGNPTLLAEGLRGCCQRLDIVARDGVLYVAENTVHRVVRMDRDGKVLGRWGGRSRTEIEGFGACCNPMNLCFGADGALYTAESGLARVKRYTADGKFLGLVGTVGAQRFTSAGPLAASCSNIAIAVTADGRRVYVMDYKGKRIRVLERKG